MLIGQSTGCVPENARSVRVRATRWQTVGIPNVSGAAGQMMKRVLAAPGSHHGTACLRRAARAGAQLRMIFDVPPSIHRILPVRNDESGPTRK